VTFGAEMAMRADEYDANPQHYERRSRSLAFPPGDHRLHAGPRFDSGVFCRLGCGDLAAQRSAKRRGLAGAPVAKYR
jgi:hypothetical protein